MGKKSRRKGRYGELEFAKLVGGKRISEVGLPGPDVIDEKGNTYEVKRPKAGLAAVYSALDQAEAESADYLAMRQDYKPWFVVVPFDTWIREKGLTADEET